MRTQLKNEARNRSNFNRRRTTVPRFSAEGVQFLPKSEVADAYVSWRQHHQYISKLATLLPWSDMLLCIGNNSPLINRMQHQGFIDVMDNTPRMLVDELVFCVKFNFRRAMIRLEHKIHALMLNLISRFSRPGQLVVDPFARTLSTAMGWLGRPLLLVYWWQNGLHFCFGLHAVDSITVCKEAAER